MLMHSHSHMPKHVAKAEYCEEEEDNPENRHVWIHLRKTVEEKKRTCHQCRLEQPKDMSALQIFESDA